MCADGQRKFAGGKQWGIGFLMAAGVEANANWQVSQPLREIAMMLLGENFRGRHEEGVIAALQCAENGESGDYGFARAYIALQQAAHGMLAGEVCLDLHRNGALRVGKLKADGFKKRFRVGGVATTGQGLGLGLEIISSSTELALKDDKFI